MRYSIRIDSKIGFIGYLLIKGRAIWKTKKCAVKHAEEYEKLKPVGYTVTIEGFL